MTLNELMLDEVKDLYHAEKQLIKALPKMAKAATDDTLRKALSSHLEETRGQVARLEKVFELLDEKPRTKPCAGMRGIIEEGSDLLEEDADGAVLDAGIIASAQRAEHYEIGAYGTVIAWARELGRPDVARLLEETLREEKAADQKLSALGESKVNAQAAREGQEEEGQEEEEAPRKRRRK